MIFVKICKNYLVFVKMYKRGIVWHDICIKYSVQQKRHTIRINFNSFIE